MSDATGETFDDEITSFIRSRCIGFQRGDAGLLAVVENLVQPKTGPLTRVYQVAVPGQARPSLLRRRPRVDIPAPPQRPETWK